MKMNQPINLKSTIPSVKDSSSRSPLRRALFLISLVLACFGLSPAARAVTPAPDGGYGGDNTAEGTNALFSLTTGTWNSAFGSRALYKNATGIRNTAVGYQALYNTNGTIPNGTGFDNVAVGANALFSNTTGKSNIAIGSYALYDNTTGSNNIAIGSHALWHFTGSGNTVVGDSFASFPDGVSVGRLPVTDCRQGVLVDGVHYAAINAETDVEVGQYLPSGCQNVPDLTTDTVHINAKSAVYVRAVYGNPIAGSAVSIDSNGQLGVATSSKRFKTNIKPMNNTSEAILALKPVTFRYKEEIDRNWTPQFGLVAEEVEKVNPDLVSRDEKGNAYTVRYEAVNAMLLNEFLKAHRRIEEQDKRIEQLTAQLKQQATLLQKVSDKLELKRAAPQMAINRQ